MLDPHDDDYQTSNMTKNAVQSSLSSSSNNSNNEKYYSNNATNTPSAAPTNSKNTREGGGGGSIGKLFDSTIKQQRRAKMKQGLSNLGSKLQKLNLGKLIDQMEQDQGLADQLESLNEHMQEEIERRDIMREAEEACLNTMKQHLDEFLNKKPDATYEEWIEDLHPENAHDGKLLEDLDKEIDLRFYVEESDHRILWNEHHQDMPLRIVPARTTMWSDQNSTQPIDLLGGDTGAAAATTTTTTNGNDEATLFQPSLSVNSVEGGINQRQGEVETETADLISF